jgi:hypothetical protein
MPDYGMPGRNTDAKVIPQVQSSSYPANRYFSWRRIMVIAALLRVLLIAVLGLCAVAPVSAQSAVNESPELYRVSTVRAAPGALLDVLALYADAAAAGHWQALGEPEPMLMRHSQGDQWDLLVLQPIGSYADYYARKRIAQREAAGEAAFRLALNKLVVFREDLFAYGPPRAQVQAAYAENGFFHIEMFAALAGRHDALLQQRQMENSYLLAIKSRPNLIWVGDQGSDVDVFTIGFYPSIVAFAAPAPVTDEQAEAAAKASGFKGRAFIGTYLRELLQSHHDTLAVRP